MRRTEFCVRNRNPVFSSERTLPIVLKRPAIIYVARLSVEKRHTYLLDCFHILSQRFCNWHLHILGDGALRSSIYQKIEYLGLSRCITLHGAVKNVPDFLEASDIFVSTSECEGFPNAICEAMAAGLPVIATDPELESAGIITNYVDGILCDKYDKSDLIERLSDLMSDKYKRQRLGRAATRIVDRFNKEHIMNQWDELFQQVSNKPFKLNETDD